MPSYHLRVAFRSHMFGAFDPGTDIVNTFHVELDALSAVSNWNNIANEMYTALGTTYRNVLGDNVTWDDIHVQTEPVSDPGTSVGLHTVNLNGTRSITDFTLGPALGILLSMKTNTPKRYARGRMWLPPASVAAALGVDNQWATGNAYWATAAAFVAAFSSGWTVGDNSYTPEIWSKRQFDLGDPSPHYPITAVVQQRSVHFLRKRTTAP